MPDNATGFTADTNTLAGALARALEHVPNNDLSPTDPVTTVRLPTGCAVDMITTPSSVVTWPHGPRERDTTMRVRQAHEIPSAAQIMAFMASVKRGAARANPEAHTTHPRTVTTTVPRSPESDEDADTAAVAAALADRLHSRDHHPVTVLLSNGTAADMAALPNGGWTAERFVPGIVYVRARGYLGHLYDWAEADGAQDIEDAALMIVSEAYDIAAEH